MVPRIFRDVDLGLGDQSKVIDEQEEIDGPTPMDQSEVSYHQDITGQQQEITINSTNQVDPHDPVINVNVFGLKKMQDIQSKSDEEDQTLSMGLTAHFKSVNKQKELDSAVAPKEKPSPFNQTSKISVRQIQLQPNETGGPFNNKDLYQTKYSKMMDSLSSTKYVREGIFHNHTRSKVMFPTLFGSPDMSTTSFAARKATINPEMNQSRNDLFNTQSGEFNQTLNAMMGTTISAQSNIKLSNQMSKKRSSLPSTRNLNANKHI